MANHQHSQVDSTFYLYDTLQQLAAWALDLTLTGLDLVALQINNFHQIDSFGRAQSIKQ